MNVTLLWVYTKLVTTVPLLLKLQCNEVPALHLKPNALNKRQPCLNTRGIQGSIANKCQASIKRQVSPA